MRAAPALDCSQCGKRIGKARTHVYVPATGTVWCLKCFSPFTGSRPVHARTYPDCPETWHDMYDHPHSIGTRAGIAALIGLWP